MGTFTRSTRGAGFSAILKIDRECSFIGDLDRVGMEWDIKFILIKDRPNVAAESITHDAEIHWLIFQVSYKFRKSWTQCLCSKECFGYFFFSAGDSGACEANTFGRSHLASAKFLPDREGFRFPKPGKKKMPQIVVRDCGIEVAVDFIQSDF